MNGLRSTLAALLALVAFAAQAADETPAPKKADSDKPKSEAAAEAKPDAERIVGIWWIESADGPFELLENAGAKGQVKFQDGKLEFKVLVEGNAVATIGADYTLDDKQTPKLLDLTVTGDGAKPVFAIYEFQDEKLRIRFRSNGDGARPVDFPVADDTSRILTLVRDKDAK